jgi:hypothetical protein
MHRHDGRGALGDGSFDARWIEVSVTGSTSTNTGVRLFHRSAWLVAMKE